MRRIVAWIVLSMAAFAPFGTSAPITGPWADQVELRDDSWTASKRFRGGVRASVSAVASGKQPGGGLHLLVYDAKGKLVAEDKGRELPAADMVAVIWYPPRDGDYRIEIRNSQGRPNKCYVAIK